MRRGFGTAIAREPDGHRREVADQELARLPPRPGDLQDERSSGCRARRPGSSGTAPLKVPASEKHTGQPAYGGPAMKR